MIDKLLSRVKEEIGIDGETGSSLETMWGYVDLISMEIAQQSGASSFTKPKIDDKYKAFFWEYLKQEDDLEFYEQLNPNSLKPELKEEGATEGQANVTTASTEDVEASPQLMDGLESEEVTIAAESLQQTTPLPEEDVEAVGTKRKNPKLTKPRKKSKPARKKAPAKKNKKAKKYTQAGSDDDFEMDESEEDEDSEDEEISDASEDFSDQSDLLDNEEFKVHPRKKQVNKSIHKTTNPRLVKLKTEESGTGTLIRIENIKDLSYEQVHQLYGSRLCVIGSAELQNEQLFVGIPPGVNITPNLIVVLKEVLKTRSKGLYQASITKLLGIDPRSTGHFVKSLEEKGAIVRHGVSINHMFTNVCVHIRFNLKENVLDVKSFGDDEDAYECPYNANSQGKVYSQQDLLYEMVDLAKDAPNQVILSEDVTNGLGFNSQRKTVRKWFNRTIDELCIKGYFKKSNTYIGTSRRPHRCLHLLKIPEDYDRNNNSDIPSVDAEEISFPYTIKSTENSVQVEHALIDTSFSSQLYQIIVLGGTNGVTQRDISFAVNLDAHRILGKCLDRILEMEGDVAENFGVARFMEFEGRLRRYRYFTYANHKKVEGEQDFVPTPLPVPEFDVSQLYERTIFHDLPHIRMDYLKYLALVASKGTRNVTLPFKKRRNANGQDDDDNAPKKSKYLIQKEGILAIVDEMIEKLDPTIPITAELRKEITARAKAEWTERQKQVRAEEVAKKKAEAKVKIAKERAENAARLRVVPGPLGATRTALTLQALGNKTPPTEESLTQHESTQQTDSEPTETETELAEQSTSTDEPTSSNRGRSRGKDSTSKKTGPTSEASEVIEPPASSDTELTASVVSESLTPVSTVIEPEVSISNTELPTTSAPSVPEPTLPATKAAESTKDMQLALSTPEAMEVDTPPPAKEPPRKTRAATRSIASKRPAQKTLVDYFTRSSKSVSRSASPAPASSAQPISLDSTPAQSPSRPISLHSTPEPTDLTMSEPEVATEPTTESTIESSTNEVAESSEGPKDDSTSSSRRSPKVVISLDRELSELKKPLESTPATEEREATRSKSPEAPSTEISASPSTDAPTNPPTAAATTTTTASASTSAAAATPSERSQSVSRASGTPQPRQEPTRKSTIVTFKKTKPATVNAYLEFRIQVFLALVEQDRFWEIGKDLLHKYEEKVKELNPKMIRHTLDGKTMWRTAIEMNKRGVVHAEQIYYTLVSGKRASRKIMYHKDISKTDPEYLSYVRQLKEIRALNSHRITPAPVEHYKAPVTRLQQRLDSMREEVEKLREKGEIRKAQELEQRTNMISGNLDKFESSIVQRNFGVPHYEPLQFGWINARLLRVKVLHRYLMRLLISGLDGTDPKDSTLATKAILDNMPLGVLCQCIGIFSPSVAVAEFASQEENAAIKVVDFPEDVKYDVFTGNIRYRRKMRHLMAMLEYIGIVEALYIDIEGNEIHVQEHQKRHMLAPTYKLNQNINIVERRVEGCPVLRQHSVTNHSEFLLFWSDLQFNCTRSEPQLEGKIAPKPTDRRELELFSALYGLRSWSVRSVFTRIQRKLLNSYVDKENETTPLEDPVLIKNISDTICIRPEDVRSYYAKVEEAMARKNHYKDHLRLERKLAPPLVRRKKGLPQKQRVISLSSTKAFSLPSRPHKFSKLKEGDTMLSEEMKEIADKRNKGEMLYLDDVQPIPTVGTESQLMKLRVPREARVVWTEQDNELLLYCYVIMRHRVDERFNRFLWTPILKVFGDRNSNSCRNHMDRIMKDPSVLHQFETSTALWETIYRTGIKKGEIVDPFPHNTADFDLLGFVTYFISKMSEGNVEPDIALLPKNIKLLRELFDTKLKNSTSLYFEDAFHDSLALVQKEKAMYTATFTLRRFMEALVDQSETSIASEDDPIQRKVNLIKTYSLMTLLTPREVYDPFHAFSTMEKFPKDLREKAFTSLRDSNILIKNGRPCIPNTRLAISIKFFKLMTGSFPKNMFVQAKEYEKFLSTQDTKIKISPSDFSSGMAACVFNLLSNYQLDISPTNSNHIRSGSKSAAFKQARASINVNIDLAVQKLCDFDEPMPDRPNTNESHIHFLRKDEYKKALSKLIDSQEHDSDASLLQHIVQLLYEENTRGLTLYELKEKLKDLYTDKLIMMAVHKLYFNNPALICRVGFEAVRYVHILYIDDWTINNVLSSKFELSEGAKERLGQQAESSKIDKKPIVIPSVWTDINGGVTELVLKECKEVILDIVLRKPGIPEADIYRSLNTAISRREIRDLLNMLVDQQCLRQVQVSIALPSLKKFSLFSKTKTVKLTNDNSIEKLSQSCFWATPRVYSGIA